MVDTMKEVGKMMSHKDMVSKTGVMEIYIKDNLRAVLKKEMVFINGMMDQPMMVNGTKAKSKAKESTNIMMVGYMKVDGNKI